MSEDTENVQNDAPEFPLFDAAEKDPEGFVHYTSPDAPKLRVMSPAGVVQFDNGVFKTENPGIVQYLEACLNEGGDLGRYVKRVQFQTAERIAKAHQQSQLAKEQMAKGATNTGHLAHQTQMSHEQKMTMQQAGLSEEEAAKVADEMAQSENLVLTQQVDQSAAIQQAIADEKAAKNPPTAEEKAAADIAENANSLNNLLGKKN